KDWFETWVDFRTALAKVRPHGAAMAEIVAEAQKRTPADADPLRKLVLLCRVMQEFHGPERAWPLSCRVAAKAIGVGHDKAAKLLKLLCLEKVIECVTPAGPKGSRR